MALVILSWFPFSPFLSQASSSEQASASGDVVVVTVHQCGRVNLLFSPKPLKLTCLALSFHLHW